MKRRIKDWLYRILAYLAPVDGQTPTLVRMKAVKPTRFVVPLQHTPTQRLRSNVHQCLPPGDMPWTGGSWYCPKCRKERIYVPLPLPSVEVITPHFVPRVRGRHNGHLLHVSGRLVDTGKLLVPGRR